MKKSLKIMFISVICAIAAACCAVFAGCNVDYAEVYNDDAKIISLNGNYSALGQVSSVHSGSAKISCFSFSGVDTLYSRFDVNGSTSANLTVDYTGENGKLKVVLTDKNNVYILTEVGYLDSGLVKSGSGNVNFENIPDGRYKLKIVGLEAGFNLELSF